jgi:predicted porin
MQKKFLALAVAGALVPAAAMAQSSVEIYGRANLAFDNWRATGSALGAAADYKARTRVVDGSSRVGFRINESLGGGMRAFAVIETGVNIDSGGNQGQGTQTNGSSGFWASRDSYLGLGGGWGDVRLGRQSIWWSNGVIAQVGANYFYTAADSLITGHMVAAPVTRQSSVISYNSPTMGGFNATVSFSPHAQESAPAGADADGSIFGITGRYTSGALRAQLDWAKSEGNSAPITGVQAENKGIKFGLGWAYAPGAQISGIVGQLENSAVTGLGTDAEVTFWLLNWEQMFGQFQLVAQLYKAGDVEVSTGDVDGSDVTGITVGGKYFLSKRTGVYVAFHQARNGDFAWADHTGGGITSANPRLTSANRGADPKMIGVGVMHNF